MTREIFVYLAQMPGDCLSRIKPSKCITLNKCVLLAYIAFQISSKIDGIMHCNGLGAENH